jgi:sugar phosphate permease
MAGVQITLFSYLAVYLVDTRGASPTLAGIGLAVALAGGTAGRLAWGVASDRWFAQRTSVLHLAAAGSAAALVALALAPRALVWPLLVVVGLCSVGWNGVFLTLVAESVRRARVGTATGTALFFLYAGGVSVPPLFGALLAASSWTVAWTSIAGLVTVALAVLAGSTHVSGPTFGASMAEPAPDR